MADEYNFAKIRNRSYDPVIKSFIVSIHPLVTDKKYFEEISDKFTKLFKPQKHSSNEKCTGRKNEASGRSGPHQGRTHCRRQGDL